jgi:predicted enzyme related to lactoylglutathione lyase
MRRYDHIDLRVRSLPEVHRFYESLLPALGFVQQVQNEEWLQYEARSPEGVAEFFGITESPTHLANECRIAFWVDTAADVDRLATIVAEAGGQKIEGPAFEEPDYYAVFFEDPSGNRLEICNRTGLGKEST